MSAPRGYRIERMSRARLALAAGQNLASRRHLMYGLVEADLTIPRHLLRAHRERTGERLSLTAYVVTCLATALAEYPELNAFRRGRSLVFLDEVIIEVLVERRIDGQPAVGYLPIRHANATSLRDIHDQIRASQASTDKTIAGQRWLELVPAFVAPLLMNLDAAQYRLGPQVGGGGRQQRGDGECGRLGPEPRGGHPRDHPRWDRTEATPGGRAARRTGDRAPDRDCRPRRRGRRTGGAFHRAFARVAGRR